MMWKTTMMAVSVATAAVAVHAGEPGGQVASAIVQEDGPLNGAPKGHLVAAINNAAVNHAGGYSFGVNSSDGSTTLSHFYGNPAGGAPTVLRTEGTFGSLVQTSFETFYGMSNAGEFGYSASGSGGPVGGFDSVWRDDEPIAVEGNPVESLPGQFWVFASRPGITSDGRVYWVGGISSSAGGGTENRGLFIDDRETPLLLGGDTPPGIPLPLNMGTPAAVDFDYRFSALGTHYITAVAMATDSSSDGAMVISGEGLMLGGSLVREGTPVPAAIGGLPGENWALFDFTGINEDGFYFFTGDTSAATTMDEIIVVNGEITYREGDTIDGQVVTGAINHAYMDEDGDLAFVWSVEAEPDNLEALFVNGEVVLMEGDLVDLDGDGAIEPESVLRDFTGISTMVIGDRDEEGNVSLYFTADIDTRGTSSTLDDVEGGFCLTVNVGEKTCVGDLNDSGDVNAADLALLLGNWNCEDDCIAELNGTPPVNAADLALLLGAWGDCE